MAQEWASLGLKLCMISGGFLCGVSILSGGGTCVTVHSLTIEAKHRQTPGYLASLADFSLSTGAEVTADIVLKQPNLSLYCLDDAQKEAIFVELPPDIDLAMAPFVYQ